MNFPEFRKMMKNVVIKKTLARRERELFHKVNNDKINKNYKIFRQMPAQNYFVGDQLEGDQFCREKKEMKKTKFSSTQMIFKNFKDSQNLDKTLKRFLN